jgi:hypothetical protein
VARRPLEQLQQARLIFFFFYFFSPLLLSFFSAQALRLRGGAADFPALEQLQMVMRREALRALR